MFTNNCTGQFSMLGLPYLIGCINIHLYFQESLRIVEFI
jgi:hypothetical protein